MCGFIGFVRHGTIYNKDFDSIRSMMDVINHRGPDSFGIWESHDHGIIMGHKRLSIQDLSESGNQPMTSFCGNWVIAYNGEIYNFAELKKELVNKYNISWKGRSDTEILVNSISILGLHNTLEKCIGMFAFSAWNKQEKKIYLVRDRAGEKPLYYGINNKIFFFGSDLNSFTRHPEWNGEIDDLSLVKYLTYNYIPHPFSIYKDIYKLSPGEILCLSWPHMKIELQKYWMPSFDHKNTDITLKEAVNHTKFLINKSVKMQMISDVPVGAFLSGGIDSSLVAAIMQAHSEKDINTFSIGFKDPDYDEAPYAKQVANILGTNHYEMYVTEKDVCDIIHRLPVIYSEPFADSSQIPTFLVSNLASQHVKVALSGDGGDELFGGYSRYFLALKSWRITNKIPFFMRKNIANILNYFPLEIIHSILSRFTNINNSAQKIKTISNLLRMNNLFDLYHAMISNNFSTGDNKKISPLQVEILLSLKDLMNFDFSTYLPGDILCKVDRAGMYNSLETRIPFLDKDIINFTQSLPENYLYAQHIPKYLLKEILKEYLPITHIERKKMGFGIPMYKYLNGPLREWSDEMIKHLVYKSTFGIEPSMITNIWKNFLDRKCDFSALWALLMLSSWDQNRLNNT